MPKSPVLWSARTCPFRRAGVYYGLSQADTHVRVARRLLPRRGRAYRPGAMAIREGVSVPLVYLAVRDPSAVRVMPVRNGAPEKRIGGEHVSLLFPSAKGAVADPDIEELKPLSEVAATDSQAGFIVTVGLRTDLEPEFHRRVVLENRGVAYSELCDVITRVKEELAE